MILPILISVSVAPGSYFFSACALPARAIASSPASMSLLTWLKSKSCITVPPGVSRWLRQFLMEQLLEPSDQCEDEYARMRSRCQRGAFLVIFRLAEAGGDIGSAAALRRKSATTIKHRA